ncbi:MAG: histidine phosphatase family protein [Pseudomonadota bacterium]
MPDFPDCYILRHGETEWNRDMRMQGRLDSPLTALGEQHAAAQGRIIAALGRTDLTWYCSPQGRAAATARIVAGPDLHITEDARLAEIDIGTWTGLTRDVIAAANPALFETDGLAWYDHAPEGEGLFALGARTRAFLDTLTGPSVIVTHGITSRVLRCHLRGLPIEAFEEVGGGQGMVHAVRGGVQTSLFEEG